MNNYLFTSESVAAGHPDKLCDQISDLILDLYLAKDPYARVAAEIMATKNKLIVSGEVNSNEEITHLEIDAAIRGLIEEVGYIEGPFSAANVGIEIILNRQSPDIAIGVDSSEEKEEGAGDQGIMFGFACKEADNYMPAAFYYAHQILKNIFDAKKLGRISGLGPDAKSQVTAEYQDGKLKRIDTILLSIQHREDMLIDDVIALVRPIIEASFPEGLIDSETKFYFNPTGRFVIGGPEGDVGLTGRKIVIDTYGGYAPHGGGAFSGKDPTKVDRSAAYISRYIAKNIVAAGVADKCLVQLSYAIGVAQPLSIFLDFFGTGNRKEQDIIDIIRENIDLSPAGIRKHLELNRPIFLQTATYGHFGRNQEEYPDFTWEKLDLVSKFKG